MGTYQIKPWEELTIKDDYMFKLVMRRKSICKRMLERILNIEIRDIRYLDEEKTMKATYQGKGIRLDLYVEDEKNTVYNVEMQVRKPEGAGLYKRTRYYQSMIDADLLAAGADYDELNQTIIIFICPFEPFAQGRHIYTFRNQCVEDSRLELGDGTTKIFLNSKGTLNDVDERVKAFLNYVEGVLSDDELGREMEKEIHHVKRMETERVSYMTYEMKLMDEWKEGRKDGWKAGREKGREEGLKAGSERAYWTMALDMLRDSEPLDRIVKYSRLSAEKIAEIAKENGLAVH